MQVQMHSVYKWNIWKLKNHTYEGKEENNEEVKTEFANCSRARIISYNKR